jgi:hypothetical protein
LAIKFNVFLKEFLKFQVNLGSRQSPICIASEPGTTTNSFVVLPANTTTVTTNISEIPVSIATVPLSTGAIITELPLDQPDTSDTSKLIENEVVSSIPRKHKLERQQSIESNTTTSETAGKQFDTISNVSSTKTHRSDGNSTSPASTLTKRSGGSGPKHSEVYV